MNYDTYRIKADGFPFYFKVATDDDRTEIYFVNNRGTDSIHSMLIREGSPLSRPSVAGWCLQWIGMISRSVFGLKIEADVSNTNEVPIPAKIVVCAKLSERKAICAKKRRANTTKRKAVK